MTVVSVYEQHCVPYEKDFVHPVLNSFHCVNILHVQGMDKIMERYVKDTHLY